MNAEAQIRFNMVMAAIGKGEEPNYEKINQMVRFVTTGNTAGLVGANNVKIVSTNV